MDGSTVGKEFLTKLQNFVETIVSYARETLNISIGISEHRDIAGIHGLTLNVAGKLCQGFVKESAAGDREARGTNSTSFLRYKSGRASGISNIIFIKICRSSEPKNVRRSQGVFIIDERRIIKVE